MNLKDLIPVGVVIVVLVIVLAFGANIVGDIGNDFTTGSAEYNVTQDGLESLSDMSSKVPTIVAVVVAALIIGILIAYFRY